MGGKDKKRNQMMSMEKQYKNRIQKKQYLGERTLTGFIVPYGTEQIEDWAFAYCKNLKWIALPTTLCRIGKEVFQGCESLRTAWFYGEPEQVENFRPEGFSAKQQLSGELNAVALCHFKNPQLFVDAYHSGGQSVPLVWDLECKAYLAMPDEAGFQPFLAGGEEDYEGGEESVMQYRHKRRCHKAEIIWKRLLKERTGNILFDEEWYRFYLQKLRNIPETLEILAQAGEWQREMIAISEEAKLLTDENIQRLLNLIPSGNVELRAMILQKAAKKTTGLWEL
ncbi:MAG: hypothetical protein E7294_05400 [Lachnospiraceae bacterium]|nr:hypothetical protein [Lachnospiraceae bacterium]